MARRDEIMTKEMYEELGLVQENGIKWYESSLKLSRIMFDLMEIPEFQEVVKHVFVEHMGGRQMELGQRIDLAKDYITDAAKADEKKWKNGDFLYEIQMMKEWVNERYNFFERIYGGVNE